MTALTIEWRPRAVGEHIEVDVLAGFDEEMNWKGSLLLRIGEFQLMAVALSMGADRTEGRVKFAMDQEAERKALAEADA